MSNIELTEEYPRQQTLTSAGKQFADRLNEFFGGGWTIIQHNVLTSSEWKQEEYVELSNGRQINVVLERSKDTLEITTSASYAFNELYLKHFSEVDVEYLSQLVALTGKDIAVMGKEETFNYLYYLVGEKLSKFPTIPGVTQSLNEEEMKEEAYLSYLFPKLMILIGKATEKNF